MRRIMVDRTELLTMREQGMTNNEIAESLGIDRSTVYNYIGGMPEELKRKSRSASHKLKTLNEAKAIERAKFDSMVPNYETEVLTKRIKANNITIDMNCKSGSCNVSVSFESNNQVRTESYAIGFEFVSGLINALKIIREEINQNATIRKQTNIDSDHYADCILCGSSCM